MKHPLPGIVMGVLVALLPALSTRAALTSVTQTWSGNVPIPDNQQSGVSESFAISTAITAITDIQVTLDIAGAGSYDGDYCAYLRSNNGGMAVLLNRVGRTALNLYGSAATGMNVTFTQTAANAEIHDHAPLSGNALTGEWQVDGRLANPNTVLDTTARTAFLNSFVGLNPNTTWTLFVADFSPGGVGSLEGFSVTVDGNVSVIPEAAGGVGGGLALGLVWFALLGRRGR